MSRVAILVLVVTAAVLLAQQREAPPLQLVQTISIPNVYGRLDHLAIDIQGKRLFVAALGNNSLEIIDVEKGKWQQSIPGLSRPQGAYYVSRLNKLFVANGSDGSCRVFGGNPIKFESQITPIPGADAVDYDPDSKMLYVGHASGIASMSFGGLAVIDASRGSLIADIKTEAPPGGIAVERHGRIFAAIPQKDEIAVIDPRRRQVIAVWNITREEQPVALALDEINHRLFVGSRKPPLIKVFDTRSGRLVTSIESVGLLDGIAYDAKRKRIYASGGEGFVEVYEQRAGDGYQSVQRIPTAFMAGTLLFVPTMNRLFGAVPRGLSREAQIRVYAPPSLR